MAIASLCVYCGSSSGSRPSYAAAARAVAASLVRRRWTLVYGGGHIGLMGVLADAVLAAGGQVVGVIPQFLVDRELAHRGLTRLHVTASLHERKALMAELSDAFVALPGGAGTLDELFEIWTWSLLGLHGKPCGILDADHYYADLIRFLDHATAQGFLAREPRERLRLGSDPEELLERLAAQ